jgi:hypothetical protein
VTLSLIHLLEGGKACLNAVSLLLAVEGQLRLVLVVVVDEKVLALVLVGHVGAGRGRRCVGGLQGLRGGEGLGAFSHGGGEAA